MREAARNELVVFGEHSIPAMAAAVPKVTMENRAPLVQTMMAAFRRLSFGLPTDYLPGLESAIWFGDRATRELAIPEMRALSPARRHPHHGGRRRRGTPR